MKEKLPSYVYKCFVAAGFDTLEVIAEMTITDGPGNSIDEIQQFISQEFPDNVKCGRGKKFPPGHRLRIKNFISDVKLLLKKQSRNTSNKRNLDIGAPSAKRSKSDSDATCSDIDQETAVILI